MRLLAIALVSLVLLGALSVPSARAGDMPVHGGGPVTMMQSAPRQVDDHDGSRGVCSWSWPASRLIWS